MGFGGSIINPNDDLVREDEQAGLSENPSPVSFYLNCFGMQKLDDALREASGQGLDYRTELLGGPEYGCEAEVYVVPTEEARRVAGVLRKLIASERLDEGWDEFAAFCERAGTRGEGFSFA